MKVNNTKTKVIMSRSKRELFKIKIDLSGVCGRRVFANSVLCRKCENWVDGRRARIKRTTTKMATGFACSRYGKIMDSIEK